MSKEERRPEPERAGDQPEPMVGRLGGPELGPRDRLRQCVNPNLQMPPPTDAGTMPNLRFAFADSHVRLQPGGWTNDVTVRHLPVAVEIADVKMHLNGGDQSRVRELPWHTQTEWAYMLAGTARITAVDQYGGNFVDDVNAGNLWFFPSGAPQSIQAHTDGAEFLLAFDDGDFSGTGTLLLSDFLRHMSAAVVAKNLSFDVAALACHGTICTAPRLHRQAPRRRTACRGRTRWWRRRSSASR